MVSECRRFVFIVPSPGLLIVGPLFPPPPRMVTIVNYRATDSDLIFPGGRAGVLEYIFSVPPCIYIRGRRGLLSTIFPLVFFLQSLAAERLFCWQSFSLFSGGM